MAQLNITLNQEEILQLLSKDHDQAFRELLRKSLDSILMAESTAQLKAEPYERSEERTDSRNSESAGQPSCLGFCRHGRDRRTSRSVPIYAFFC